MYDNELYSWKRGFDSKQINCFHELTSWITCLFFRILRACLFSFADLSFVNFSSGSVWRTKAYTIAIRLWVDYDTTTTKNWHVHFMLASNRVEWKPERAIRRSRIVVVSQSNWTHRPIVISITSVLAECVVVSSNTLWITFRYSASHISASHALQNHRQPYW